MSSFIQYVEMSLFTFPELKDYLLGRYKGKLQVNTRPTKKGEGVMIDNYLYPAKRIWKRGVTTIGRELWTLVEHAERLGLIEVQFVFEWEDEKDRKFREGAARHLNREINIEEIDRKDEIYLSLRDNYVDRASNSSTAEDWNRIRKQILLCFLYANIFPLLVKEVRRELHESS
jgi:hypothetical protein